MQHLPQAWIDMFDGERLAERVGISALLSTVGEDGWPHASFLGVGEVLADGPDGVSLMLWPHSTTAANLARSRRAVLFAAVEGSVWEARLEIQSEGAELEGEPRIFRTAVVAVRRHHAPYAEVHGMIGFTLLDPMTTVERWERQVERLRAPD
jgi:hypothetical protein